IDRGRVDVDLALLLEHPAHGVRRTEITAEPRHLAADFGHGAGGIVGDGVDQECDATGAVALVRHFLVVDTLELAGALLHGALEGLVRHAVTSAGYAPGRDANIDRAVTDDPTGPVAEDYREVTRAGCRPGAPPRVSGALEDKR